MSDKKQVLENNAFWGDNLVKKDLIEEVLFLNESFKN
jgi:hypothetical protein